MTNTSATYPMWLRSMHSVHCISINGSFSSVVHYVCVDTEHCELIAAQTKAGNAYEAHHDGAIPFDVLDAGSDAIERLGAKLSREYDRASSALIEYRRNHA